MSAIMQLALVVVLLLAMAAPQYGRVLGAAGPPAAAAAAAQQAQQQHQPQQQKDKQQQQQQQDNKKQQPALRRVIVDHDGGVEDIIAVLLLLVQAHVDVRLISYVEADSIKSVATNTTLKILARLNSTITPPPVAVSSLSPLNPFPMAYRGPTLAADVVPALNPAGMPARLEAMRAAVLQARPGQEVLAEVLAAQDEPVALVATGPLTNLAYVLQRHPAAASKISHVWWMGGTLRAPGNIFNQPASDGKAEWNAFADPQALAVVMGSSVPLTLIPLDATNQVPITPDLIYRMGSTASPLAHLVASMYAPTVSWVYISPQDAYYAWDCMAVACMLRPQICSYEDLTLRAVVTGKSAGVLRIVDDAAAAASDIDGDKSSSSASSSGGSRRRKPGGGEGEQLSAAKRVTAAVWADAAAFESFVLETLSSAAAGPTC